MQATVTKELLVAGIDSEQTASAVEKAVGGLEGVKKVKKNLVQKTLLVEYTGDNTACQECIAAVMKEIDRNISFAQSKTGKEKNTLFARLGLFILYGENTLTGAKNTGS